MAKQRRKEWDDMSKTEKTVGLVILAIVAIIIIAVAASIAGSGTGDDAANDSQPSPSQEAGNDNSSGESGSRVSLSESDAEKFCQDDNLTPILTGNSQYSDINMIDMWNYNKKYIEVGEENENGYPVMQLSWNGKKGDDTVAFSCYVSGTKENTVLHYLSMDGETMHGDPNFWDEI